ncbi:MAG: flavin reductase family protein [Eubacteriales bacterium]|nr:flavin reductase family protein [Eubacteriales bacterium]
MKEVSFTEIAGIVIKQMRNGGVFLTTSDGTVNNVMTIGWGGPNVFFNQPCFIAPVRKSRYSYRILQKNAAFTVSVPLHDMKEQLAVAGSKSGRDMDKFSGHGMTAAPAQAVNVPIVAECELHIECEPMGTLTQSADTLPQDVLDRFYASRDMHTFFLGKVVKCYYTK